MRIPKSLETLADDGLIQEVVRPLMSGKEAQIYLVVSENRECAAKIYKDAQNRSFKNRADYVEGRKVRNSRDQRAMTKGTKYGREKDEDAWKSTEVDTIYRLRAAGVRVPTPYTFVDGVLVMELVTDAEGNPAPRLGDVHFTPEEAHQLYRLLLREVCRMLCAGIVHGDLSEFNVLLAADGPVVIDFPQAVSAAGNNNARALLIRDVNNLHRFLERWAPGVRRRPYAEEMWALYESNRLTPDSPLSGQWRSASRPVDTRAVQALISDARRDGARREQPRGTHRGGSGFRSDGPQPSAATPMRRREVVVVSHVRHGASRAASPGASVRSGPPRSQGPSRSGPPRSDGAYRGGPSRDAAAGRGPSGSDSSGRNASENDSSRRTPSETSGGRRSSRRRSGRY
jgi:RIO kinase 1